MPLLPQKPSSKPLTRFLFPFRSLSTTAARQVNLSDQLAGRLWDPVSRALFGRRRERENQRQRGGLLPEEARRLQQERERDAALGAISSDGEALFDEPEQQAGALRARTANQARESFKREVRAARKRWGASTNPVAEHKYSTATFKISPQKLQLLADQIAHKPIDHAILQMQFSSKRAAQRVKSTLALARDHAAEKGMDVTRLVVDEAWVGKGTYLARVDLKGRSRMGKKHHPSAKLSIVLRYGKTWEQREKEEINKAVRRVRSMATGGIAPVQRPIINVHQRAGWQI